MTLFPADQPQTGRSLARLAMVLVAPLMIGAVVSGLYRLGWELPLPQPNLALAHGPLFVCGVLGTLISLERAVALGRPWAFVSPVLTASGGLTLLIGLPGALGATLITLGSGSLLAVFAVILPRMPARFLVSMALGALSWLCGNLLWLVGQPVALVVPWWAGFLILTIVGERLELGRLRQLPAWTLWIFSVGVAALLAGLLLSLVAFDLGARLVGAAILGLAVWLLRYDIARRTIRKAGLPRYSAVCILSGSVWLGVSGGIGLVVGAHYAGPLYDAQVHALFVGFVFAMIFGHAPIIVPAVLGVSITFLRLAYLPLIMLHFSLILRLTGDLAGLGELRRWGGMLNAMAIALFVAVTLLGSWQAHHANALRLQRSVQREHTE